MKFYDMNSIPKNYLDLETQSYAIDSMGGFAVINFKSASDFYNNNMMANADSWEVTDRLNRTRELSVLLLTIPIDITCRMLFSPDFMKSTRIDIPNMGFYSSNLYWEIEGLKNQLPQFLRRFKGFAGKYKL